jgi:hypothetical protein
VEVAGVVGAQKSRFPSGMTNKKGKGEKRIPYGNDKQEGEGKKQIPFGNDKQWDVASSDTVISQLIPPF